MDFLRDQERRAQEREQKLLGEKRQLEERVGALEEELRTQVALNKDLVKKIRLIEYSMLNHTTHNNKRNHNNK